MEEDTKKTGLIVTKSDEDQSEMKKISIKFANNPKVLNMCQLSQERALPTKSPYSFTSSSVSNVLSSPTSQTCKSISATTSLLKKLPGNISVSTQKVLMPQQQQSPGAAAALSQQSLIPNKPVVVQPINPKVTVSSTVTGPSVCVNASRKIVFNPGDSRFLKIVNATPDQSSISAGKKVIVQRVEQIQPPHAKSVVVQGASPQVSPMKQNKVIVLSGNQSSASSSVVVTGRCSYDTGPTMKTQQESYIVNEMPPEMRTKAIVVSSNNPTGDTQGGVQKVLKIPVQVTKQVTGVRPEMTQAKLDPGKIAPVTITKKLLPIRPAISVTTTPVKDKLPMVNVSGKGPTGTQTTFRRKSNAFNVNNISWILFKFSLIFQLSRPRNHPPSISALNLRNLPWLNA